MEDGTVEFAHIHGTELTASRVGLGTWAIGGWMWGGTDERVSIRTIHAALDRGINLIDTAPVYGFGRSEEIVGKAVAQYGHRHEILIATKVGLEWRAEGIIRNASGPSILREVDESLRRLRTDHIDIYQVHWPDDSASGEETARTMEHLLRDGKIRAMGVSNYSPHQMDEFRRNAPLHTVQPPYNLFERGIERDILPYCEQHGIATLTYGALCRGLLSGRMRPQTQFAGDDLRRIDPKFQQPRYGQYLAAVDALGRFAREKYGKTVLDLAVRWLMDQASVSVALWGARSPEQLDAIPGVFGWHLEPADMETIDDIIDQNIADPVGSEFMAPPSGRTGEATA
jgi:aryl-alcohol dehydrogenase-like predicted oxidoreductase